MNTEVRISPADTLDAETCRRLILRSEPWITLQYGEAEVQALLRSVAGANLLTARCAGRTVAFALSSSGVLLGEYLRMLVVEAPFRSQGVGRRLMEELEQRAFRRWPNVYLCVSDFNIAARQFYERLGYETVGCLHDLLLSGKGEILMRKSVASWRQFGATRQP